MHDDDDEDDTCQIEMDAESQELYDEAGAASNPKDYYFWAENSRDSYLSGTQIAICPKKFYDANGYQFDQHLTIDSGGLLDLPEVLEEIAEASFVFDGSVADAETILINLGMTKNKMNL